MRSFWIVLAFTLICVIGLSAVTFLFFKEQKSFSHLRDEFKRELKPTRRHFYDRTARLDWKSWLKYHVVARLRNRRRALAFYSPGVEIEEKQESTWESIREMFRSAFRLRLPGKRLSQISLRDSETGFGKSTEEFKGRDRWGHRPANQAPIEPVYSNRRNVLHPQTTLEAADWYKRQLEDMGYRTDEIKNPNIIYLRFSPDGRWLAVCHTFTCSIYDVEVSDANSRS
jgi:hypothetical protein